MLYQFNSGFFTYPYWSILQNHSSIVVEIFFQSFNFSLRYIQVHRCAGAFHFSHQNLSYRPPWFYLMRSSIDISWLRRKLSICRCTSDSCACRASNDWAFGSALKKETLNYQKIWIDVCTWQVLSERTATRFQNIS